MSVFALLKNILIHFIIIKYISLLTITNFRDKTHFYNFYNFRYSENLNTTVNIFLFLLV